MLHLEPGQNPPQSIELPHDRCMPGHSQASTSDSLPFVASRDSLVSLTIMLQISSGQHTLPGFILELSMTGGR